MIDEDLEKAKKAVARFKELNKNTIERVKVYDSKMKCWYYERIKTDENAKKFQIKPRAVSKLQPKPNAVSKPKKKKVKEIKPKKIFRRNQVYNDSLNGMTIVELAKKYNVSNRQISSDLSDVRKSLGLVNNVFGKTFSELVPYFKEGLSIKEISNKVNLKEETIWYHRNRYLKGLKPKQ